jgi:glycosyltransferase involved in cell wall biosynthesis
MSKSNEETRESPSSASSSDRKPTARNVPDTGRQGPGTSTSTSTSHGYGNAGSNGNGNGNGNGRLLENPVGRLVRTLPSAPGAKHSNRPLIVHSHLRWDFVWQRPQQIFSRLATRHPILFTEEPMLIDGPATLVVTEPHPNVLRAVPMLTRGAHADVDQQWAAVLPMLREALEHHPLLAGRFGSAVQWFYSPMTAPHFLGQFDAACVVYDCMDELANFRFAPADIGRRERMLLERADVVFTGGYRLYEAKAQYHDNVHFFGCGVDVAHYGKARLEQTEVPPELAQLPGPVFGYFGVIDERIDYELIDRLAQEFPAASIAMVGPLAKVERESLPTRPNIHWLGQRSYDDLPALVKAFDVCLMPFALNEATRFINPTKTLEYMAAGKPIVSTAVPDVMRNFTPIVEVALDHDAFVDAVEQAHLAPCAELIGRGLDRANRATWESIVEAMRAHLLEALDAVEALEALEARTTSQRQQPQTAALLAGKAGSAGVLAANGGTAAARR